MEKEVEATAGTNGWVKLWRSVMETGVWKDKPFARGQAWVDLIMLAGHKDKEFWFNATCLTLTRGEFVTSKRKLGDRWGWSNSKVDKFLKELQKVEMILVKSDHRKTIIKITNYDKYQSSDGEATEKRQSSVSQTTVKRQSSDSEATEKRQSSDSEASKKRTIKKNKNIKEGEEGKKEKEGKEEPAALSPSETIPESLSGEAGYTDENGERWYTGDELLAMTEEEIQALMKQGEEQGEKDGAV